jgi:hypothetical protein
MRRGLRIVLCLLMLSRIEHDESSNFMVTRVIYSSSEVAL